LKTFLLSGVLGLALLLLATGGPGAVAAPPDSLQGRIDRASPGDTITVEGGTFNERITIDKPLILEGQDNAVIDGGGDGDVVTITADDVTVSRFVIRNSGRAVSQEPAAVKIKDANNTTIQYNTVEQSHFGIHATGSHEATITYNTIDVGAGVPQERRGHAIYLWEVESSVIGGNTINNSADGIHLEFSHDNGIGQNTVTGSRYALHFMTSHNNRVVNNDFHDNLTGAVLMFSNDLLMKDNQLSNNRQGASGAGMLIKDVNNIFAEGNVIQRNKYGITVEGTPNIAGATATFIRNLIALNDTGIGIFPNAPITFVENAMIENTVQVEAMSGSLASIDQGSTDTSTAPSGETAAQAGAVWAGNYWSDYKGHDGDGDGIGDQPYRPEPGFAGSMKDHPILRLFQFTVAQQAIDMAAEMFPVFQYNPVMEDSQPLMEPLGPALPGRDNGVNTPLLITGILLLGLALAVLQLASDFDPIGSLVGGARRRLSRGAPA
jgi:nitrous oxidase accessory protein